jgi:Family of unknown function (DUF6941)
MTPNPTVVGLWICERVIYEYRTMNPSIISIFNLWRFPAFPTECRPFSVICGLTDAQGTGRIELRVSDAESNDRIFTQFGPIRFPDRLLVVHGHFRVKELSFPWPGVYSFDVFVDGEYLCSQRLRIEEE